MPNNQTISDQPLVMQFAKWPEAGKVKTRLIPALGEQGALAAHCVLTLAVLDNLLATALPLQLWWDCDRAAPAEAAELVKALQWHGVPQRYQSGGSLGDRMAAALSGALDSHKVAMIVGSDCPSVDAAHVLLGAEKLAHVDVVLGPSEDGGYVLIGARKVVPGMLDGIDWGSERVLRQTCEKLESAGLSVGLLSMRWDVDEAEDWQRFQREFMG
ncbi:MAG TPA: TIGR04282 family arsenosugar biosynthesis glycosyltransferase [Marinobacter sp.]|nr:TIGR04282 family arsenosugar biosynthesis glycosyltransferase [Marinobacter sp.]